MHRPTGHVRLSSRGFRTHIVCAPNIADFGTYAIIVQGCSCARHIPRFVDVRLYRQCLRMYMQGYERQACHVTEDFNAMRCDNNSQMPQNNIDGHCVIDRNNDCETGCAAPPWLLGSLCSSVNIDVNESPQQLRSSDQDI